jgi:hypothetical protein
LAAGAIGLRLVDVPVSAGGDPRAQLYIVDHLAPGTVIERRIEVSNTTASTAHVVLYPAAATIEHGSFLGSAGDTPNDLSTWTSVLPGVSDVPAGGHLIATVTIAVPDDAAPGEQYGVVWAEVRSAPTVGGGVIEVNRVGIRLYLSVGPGGAPAADFTIDSLTAERSSDGQPIVLAAVHNTGGRALDMSGTLELASGPGGLSAGPFAATLGTTMAIGETELVRVALDTQIPAGPWDARITLRSGLLERSARATITFPATGAAPPVTISTLPAWLYPAFAGVALFLMLGLAILLILWSRRGRRHVAVPEHRVVHPAEAGLEELAPFDELGLLLDAGRARRSTIADEENPTAHGDERGSRDEQAERDQQGGLPVHALQATGTVRSPVVARASRQRSTTSPSGTSSSIVSGTTIGAIFRRRMTIAAENIRSAMPRSTATHVSTIGRDEDASGPAGRSVAAASSLRSSTMSPVSRDRSISAASRRIWRSVLSPSAFRRSRRRP